MPEFQPVALGPIAVQEPSIIREGWRITNIQSSAPLTLTDATPLAKILVKADPCGAIANALALPFALPFGQAKRDDTGALLIGSSPGEWLILAAQGSANTVVERIRERAEGEFVTIIDQTSARALLKIRGEQSAAILSKICAIDFADETTPSGAALRTSVAKLVTDIVREDDEGVPAYWLHCEWSSGQYLFDSLMDAGREFGLEVDGFRTSFE